MKKLNQFLEFNVEKFFEGKVFVTTGISEWRDFDTNQKKGTKVETVIAKDETRYDLKDGELVSNIYERLIFKIPNKEIKEIKVPMNAQVMPKNVKATVYGEYRNQLSCIAEDIVVVDHK